MYAEEVLALAWPSVVCLDLKMRRLDLMVG